MMNLTAITDPDQVVDLHMLDSAALLTVDDFSGKKVIDVGTGARFPGMVLKVLEPTIELTLLDSLGKRVNWLSELSAQLGAAPVECIHGRAEEQALLEGYRDCYDLAVSRAVADLRILAELCLPFVKVGGAFVPYKSGKIQEEIEAAGKAVEILGGRIGQRKEFMLPGSDMYRCLLYIEKVKATAKKYPRKVGMPTKEPLH